MQFYVTVSLKVKELIKVRLIGNIISDLIPIILIFFQAYASVVASFTYFAMGEIRSWSSAGIPSLQGKDGRNATLSQGPLPTEVVSWISKLTRFIKKYFIQPRHLFI